MRTNGRIDALDAVRGCAMVLVCVSHVRHHFDAYPTLYFLLTAVTRIATPTFLLLSGFVAAHLLRSDSEHRMAVTLVDRGLFLLVVAHLLLGLADLPKTTTVEWLFARASIPDAIGVALCVAVLFRRSRVATLLALGASLCVISWFVALLWEPETPWTTILGRLLFNVRSASTWLSDVALLPYLGTFLIGMALSAHLRGALIAADDRIVARRLLLMGCSAMTVVVATIATWFVGKTFIIAAIDSPVAIDVLRQTINPGMKWPPGPAYLLFYGGAGLAVAGFFFYGRPRWLVPPIIRITSVIGRASLMCFVLQDWLLFVVPQVFGFAQRGSLPFWMGYLAIVLLALYMAANAWGRIHGNRFFTVGLKALHRKHLQTARANVPNEKQGTVIAGR